MPLQTYRQVYILYTSVHPIYKCTSYILADDDIQPDKVMQKHATGIYIQIKTNRTYSTKNR